MGGCCGKKVSKVEIVSAEEKKFQQFQAINEKAKAPLLTLDQSNLYKKRFKGLKGDKSNANDSVEGEDVVAKDHTAASNKVQSILVQSYEQIQEGQDTQKIIKPKDGGDNLKKSQSKQQEQEKISEISTNRNLESQDELNSKLIAKKQT